jgi:hypothetical protein
MGMQLTTKTEPRRAPILNAKNDASEWPKMTIVEKG